MLVQEIMLAHPVTATVDARVPDLVQLLRRHGFRHIPILDGAALVGIVSDRDIKQAMTSAALASAGRERERLVQELTAGDIMTRRPTTIGPTAGVEDAARLMATRKISALPVTDGDRLLGIVTETDVLQLFVRALGVLEPSTRLEVLLSDPLAGLSGVVRAVEDAGDRISSAMTLAAPDGGREVVLRVATIDPRPAVKALQSKGYVVREAGRGPREPAPS